MHYEAELVILVLLGLVCEGYVICRVVEGNGSSGREVMEWHILTFLDWELRMSVV